jgi:hypothetical protein
MTFLDPDVYVVRQLELARALAEGTDPSAIDLAAAELVTRARQSKRAGCEIPALWLDDRLELSPREGRVLWLLVAHELCPDVRQRLRALATEAVADVTHDTVRRLVYGASPSLATWRELGPRGKLRQLVLVEETSSEAGPEQRQILRVARRVLALVHGDVALDPEIDELACFAGRSACLEQLEVDHGSVESVRRAIAANEPAIVYGRVACGRRSLLECLAREASHHVLRVDARKLPTDRDRLRRQLRVIHRECRLHDCVPLLQHVDALADASELLETELTGLILATSTRVLARQWRRPPRFIELKPPTTSQRARLWSRALPEASAADADLLAALYPLAPGLIVVAGAAARRACAESPMQPNHVEAGIRAVLDDRLSGLATRVTVTQSWDDLVLPDDQMSALVELLARIRKRRLVLEDWGFATKIAKALGVCALFSGPPGTGKTMAAGLIARDLGVDAYQVDLSKIVSKWIGETEKNLAALFDAAEAGHAILLFDEADAVFGKRTSVASSNDRHANQEINYLLQRLETFSGTCILTTNHENAIDDAFRRRFSIHVRFPIPDADEREQLWRVMVPMSAPLADDVKFRRLANSFVMSGGYIRNAILRAAFLAADEEAAIAASHLERAARLEYEAMGKLIGA